MKPALTEEGLARWLWGFVWSEFSDEQADKEWSNLLTPNSFTEGAAELLALLGFTQTDVEALQEAHNGYDSGDSLRAVAGPRAPPRRARAGTRPSARCAPRPWRRSAPR